MKSKTMKRLVSTPLSLAMLMSAMAASPMALQAKSPAEHTTLARSVAADGMVLLENNGALPLKEKQQVAMFGRAMIDYVRGGGGSGATNVDYTVNILQGMQNKEKEGKVSLYKPLVDFYTEQVSKNGIKNDADITVTDEMIADAAAASDTAVVTIGRYSSEGSDRTATKGDYYLSDAETDLLQRVAAQFDNTVVILNVGAVLDTSWIQEIDGISAVLQSYQAGMEGGNAVADVLMGDVNPSGKTVDTYAASYEDYPSSDTFYESSAYINYEEDIFVGYRYFETFDPDYQTVNYEFGYGLSYTTFALSDIKAHISGDSIVTEATVTNTGDRPGREVVQTYFSAPQGELGKPAKELASFAKTSELAPGESETVVMSYAIDDMSSYDDTGAVAKSAYVLEAGDYNVYVGNSIRNAGERGSIFEYTVEEDTITEQLSEQCAPSLLPRRLKADGSFETLFDPSSENRTYPVSASEQTRIEMENHSAAHETIRTETYYDDDFNQNKCMAYMNSAGLWAEYTLDAEEAGRYEVILSYANGYADIVNPFDVLVDDDAQPGITFTAVQTGDGSNNSEWYNFQEGEPIYINLKKGVNKVRFVSKGQNPNYDYMKLRRVGDAVDVFDKTVPAAGGRIEGESYNYSGKTTSTNAVRVEHFVRDGKDEACLAYMNYVGNFAEYYLNVEQAGEYDLILNTANGRESFNFDPGISVDGQKVDAVISAVQTGDGDGKSEWYNFEDLEAVTVTLPHGHCKLRLTGMEANKYPNVDYFRLVPKADAGNTASFTARKAARTMPQADVQADDGQTPAEKIMLIDVYENPELMDAFLEQISDEQMIVMLGGQPNTGTANTGGMGNLMEFGIPNAMTADGPQGIRIGNTCTAWPVSTLLASTWDTDLIEEVGRTAGKEAAANGIDIWLAPGMNIHRDPLCGRNFEYYSEDPLLTGKMAAAMTRGSQSQNVSITLKHFCVNNKETNRNSVDTRLSERALREIYLKGFEIAVKESDPWSIMTSYNFLNGFETSENYQLLTNIARGEWNFGGIFMTDWGNNSNHARELMAGNDVKMPSGSPDVLKKALERGVITRDDLKASIRRLMEMIMKTNVFQTKIVNPAVTSIGDDTIFKAAENMTWSQTVRSETTGDEDGGLNLGYCDAGGWAEYWIDIAKAGTYDLSARSASNAGKGAFDVLIDGEVIASFDVPGTGGWQKWTTLDAQTVTLPAGKHLMRIAFTESGSNLNWLRFTRIGAGDKRLLETAIPYAEQAREAESYTHVHPLVKEKFEAALANAKAVYENPKAAQSEINAAWIELCEAVHYLSFTSDKSLLEEMVNQAEIIESELDQYTGDTAAFQEALDAAREVLDNPNALDASIEKALEALEQAMSSLSRKPSEELDLSVLRMLVTVSDDLDLDAYMETGKAEFSQALAEAKAVLEAPESQEQIDAMVNTLHGAYLNLRLKADESLLQALAAFVETVNNMDLSAYSSIQVEQLNQITREITAALDNHAKKAPELGQKEALELKVLMEKGQKILDAPENKAVSQSLSAGKSSTAKSASSVKTAASTFGILYAGLLGAAASAAAMLKRRRNRK